METNLLGFSIVRLVPTLSMSFFLKPRVRMQLVFSSILPSSKAKVYKDHDQRMVVENGNPIPKSPKVADEFQHKSIQLASSPDGITLEESCIQLKAELRELQSLELLDIKQEAHVNWLTQEDEYNFFWKGCEVLIGRKFNHVHSGS